MSYTVIPLEPGYLVAASFIIVWHPRVKRGPNCKVHQVSKRPWSEITVTHTHTHTLCFSVLSRSVHWPTCYHFSHHLNSRLIQFLPPLSLLPPSPLPCSFRSLISSAPVLFGSILYCFPWILSIFFVTHFPDQHSTAPEVCEQKPP